MNLRLSDQIQDPDIVRENFRKIRKAFENPYDLPIATDAILGGIKVGSGLSIDETGVLVATGATWGGIGGSIGDQTDLISGGKILASLLPALAITDTYVVSSEAEMLALGAETIPAETGDICVRTDETKTYILKGSDPSVLADWELLLTPTGGVVSVFGRSGAVTAQSGDYSFSLISGTAGPTQGGTGLTTYTKGDVLIATGTNIIGVVGASATDGYVFTWDAVSGLPMWKAAAGGSSLPSMTGNGGKFLKTDGTTASWATVSIDTAANYTWTGNHIFNSGNATVFGSSSFISTLGYGQTSLSVQLNKPVQVSNNSTDSIILSGDPASFIKVRRQGSFETNLFGYIGNPSALTVNPFFKFSTNGFQADGLGQFMSNLRFYKQTSTGEQGIIFWNAGNGNRHAIIHSDNTFYINTCDAGDTPNSSVGFKHLVLVGDRNSTNGVTQQTLIRSAINGFGGGITSVSAAACLEVTNYPTLNFFGVKFPILTTKDRNVIFQNAIPSGSNFTGSFTNGSANISAIQNVVIAVGDIISIRTAATLTEISRAIILSVDTVAKTAVMDRPFSGTTGTYYLPHQVAPQVPVGLFIFNSDADAPQIYTSTGWKTFNLT